MFLVGLKSFGSHAARRNGYIIRTPSCTKRWLRLTMVHWARVLPGVAAGNHTLRCRAIDQHGVAQPQPRPFRKSGHAAIEQWKLVVT
jgi:hypothetical protein